MTQSCRYEYVTSGRKRVFLIKERVAPGGRRFALIYMTFDGSFEGRIYTHGEDCKSGELAKCCTENYEICAITETLPRTQVLVDEELGLL